MFFFYSIAEITVIQTRFTVSDYDKMSGTIKFSEFSKFLSKLSISLDDRDAARMKLVISTDKQELGKTHEFENLRCAESILGYLWKYSFFTEENLRPLIDLMEAICRHDTVAWIKDFGQTKTWTVNRTKYGRIIQTDLHGDSA